MHSCIAPSRAFSPPTEGFRLFILIQRVSYVRRVRDERLRARISRYLKRREQICVLHVLFDIVFRLRDRQREREREERSIIAIHVYVS